MLGFWSQAHPRRGSVPAAYVGPHPGKAQHPQLPAKSILPFPAFRCVCVTQGVVLLFCMTCDLPTRSGASKQSLGWPRNMIRLSGLAAGLAPSGWQLKSSSALLEGARRGHSSDLKRQPVVAWGWPCCCIHSCRCPCRRPSQVELGGDIGDAPDLQDSREAWRWCDLAREKAAQRWSKKGKGKSGPPTR